MPTNHRSLALALLAAATSLCACSDDPLPPHTDGAADLGPDAPADLGVDVADSAAADLGSDALKQGAFTRIVSGGIDDRLNGYPWAMELFDGDKDGTPEVYVGTVQNPLCVQAGAAGAVFNTQVKPPKRWQCLNSLWGKWLAYLAASASAGHIYRGVRDQTSGAFSWTRVLSPQRAETSGFRGARVFSGALYMLGVNLTGGVVWKSTDGTSWSKASPPGLAPGNLLIAGGLRGAQVFKGKLYVANNGICEIYASSAPSTDPISWNTVNSTGFVKSGGKTDA